MAVNWLCFWRRKAEDPNANLWRPQPGMSPFIDKTNLPGFIKRMDVEATIVDVAPFIASVGAVTHVSQMHSFGFTVSANLFKNERTLLALHRSFLVATPAVLLLQAAGIQYRNFIPRWAHVGELQRDEEIVRQHIGVGMALGGAGWFARMAFRLGMRYWAPIEVLAGGALLDIMQREYIRAHGF